MIKDRHQRRRLRRNLNLLAANEFFASSAVFTPIAVLIFESLTGSFTKAMSVFSIMSLMIALSEVPTGVLSDKWGRRRTLIIGSISEMAAITCYIFAFSSTHSLLFLYLGACLKGFGEALFSGNNHAMIYETLAAFNQTKVFPKAIGRFESMGQVGLALAGIFAACLLWFDCPYVVIMALSLGILTISTTIAFFTIEPPKHYVRDGNTWQHMKTAAKLIVKSPKLRLLGTASIISNGGGYANYYFTPGFIDSVWPHWLTPIYRTVQNGIGSVSFWYAGHIIKRFGAMKVLFSGNVIASLIGLWAYWIANFFSPLLMMLTQFAYGFGETSNRSLQQETFSDAQRATMGSLISFGRAIMTAILTLVMGWLADYLASTAMAMFITLAVRSVIVNALYVRLYKNHK